MPETPFQCRCWTKQGTGCVRKVETIRGRVAHEVRATDLGGTHGLKLHATTISNACPMCQTIFANLQTARNHEVTSLRTGRCHVYRSVRAGGRTEQTEMTCPDPSCTSTSVSMSELRLHIIHTHLGHWSPHHECTHSKAVHVDVTAAASILNNQAAETDLRERERHGKLGAPSGGVVGSGKKHTRAEWKEQTKMETPTWRMRSQVGPIARRAEHGIRTRAGTNGRRAYPRHGCFQK